MQTLIIWLMAAYGVTVCWVQICRWLHVPRKESAVYYCIYTYNSQEKIEWVMRSLFYLSRLEGRSFHYYIADAGSTDDTLKIIEKLIKQGNRIEVIDSDSDIDKGEEGKIILIDLEGCYQCEYKTT
ncbi:glycosyltransferase [Caldalkalibacillus mannanilyticus]|uniref:glycosyltransferase n=1 Tax=Caldalkalibacillus mannanilyticus TaxID=1418 RepID=UPI0004699D6A|nr:glycosyltransferase [Caldalkalibacillus mannanilyticus]